MAPSWVAALVAENTTARYTTSRAMHLTVTVTVVELSAGTVFVVSEPIILC